MKKIFSSFWLRCSGALLISAVVSLTAFSAWSRPRESVTQSTPKQSINFSRPQRSIARIKPKRTVNRLQRKRYVNTAQAKPNQSKAALKNQIAKKILQMQASEGRWIQVDLSRQRLIAWEGTNPVRAVIVSTGKKSTPTRVGTFAVKTKHKSVRMVGPGYDVSNVPHTMYYSGGYAIHGAYWHRRFGTPVSHGCINVALDHARWVFNWADVGTPIIIHE